MVTIIIHGVEVFLRVNDGAKVAAVHTVGAVPLFSDQQEAEPRKVHVARGIANRISRCRPKVKRGSVGLQR